MTSRVPPHNHCKRTKPQTVAGWYWSAGKTLPNILKHYFAFSFNSRAAEPNCIIGRSCHKYNFCCDKTHLLSWQKYACCDKHIFDVTEVLSWQILSRQLLSWQTNLLLWWKYAHRDNTFCATKMCLSQQKSIVATTFCCDKHNFVMTSCHDNHTFVATKDVICRDKHMFVVTKVLSQQKLYLSAPANNRTAGGQPEDYIYSTPGPRAMKAWRQTNAAAGTLSVCHTVRIIIRMLSTVYWRCTRGRTTAALSLNVGTASFELHHLNFII